MTTEQAISNLKRAKCVPYKKDTLTMAIKSLELEPKIRQILDISDFDFNDKHGMDREWISYLGLNDILTDYTDMFRMLSDIKDIIDNMIQEGDENNELQRSTGTEI